MENKPGIENRTSIDVHKRERCLRYQEDALDGAKTSAANKALIREFIAERSRRVVKLMCPLGTSLVL